MSSQTRDIHIQRFDLEGARSWMSGICGPHRLATATPERLRFHHSANVFKSRATTLGVIEYGTDVTIDAAVTCAFMVFSLLGGLISVRVVSRIDPVEAIA